MNKAASGPLLELRRVSKYYERGFVSAVRDVSFSIEAGSIVALTGPSGCGKSTLLNLMGALDVPSSGSIFYAGRPLRNYKPFNEFRSHHVGFVFQQNHMVPEMTLLENVELPLYANRSYSRTQRRNKAEKMLDEQGLRHRADFRARDVSGGERQRAAVARALVNDPQLLIADEPTGSVDSATGSTVLTAITKHIRMLGGTVIIATHNERLSASADCHLEMLDGQLLSSERT